LKKKSSEKKLEFARKLNAIATVSWNASGCESVLTDVIEMVVLTETAGQEMG
jgi:hypothetical protein